MAQIAVPLAPHQRTWLPLVLLLANGSLLGLSTNLAKLAGAAGLDPLAFLCWSVVGAALVHTSIAALRHRRPTFNARTVEYFVVAGLVGVAAPNLLFFGAVPHIGASFVALAIAFPPLFTYLGSLLLGLERFQPRRALGVALALCGAVLLAVLKLTAPDVEPFWVMATLGGSLLLAVGNIYRTQRWPKGAAPDTLAPGVLTASALLLLVCGGLASFIGGADTALSLSVPLQEEPLLLIVAHVAILSIQYLLYFALQKLGGPVYLSLLGSVGAVVGVPIAVLVLGEAVPRGLVLGGTLIALGVGLLTRTGSRASSSVAVPGTHLR